MRKILIVAGILVLVAIIGSVFFRMRTKSFSPEADVNYNDNNVKIHVFYNRPFKKGRAIFGGLEPYGKVWRTGANEATIFETNKDLLIKDKILKAGTYTLWTIPEAQTWTVMLNSEYGQWGVNFDGVANRDPVHDVLSVQVPVLALEKEIEQFTIMVEKVGETIEMNLMWDKTLISIPITVASQ